MRLREQAQIVARIEEISLEPASDVFGWRREVLIGALDFEHAKPYVVDGATAEMWTGYADTEAEAREYLEFAVGKIRGHRGISASRSPQKLTEFAWLLDRGDVMAAMAAAEHPQYGAPIVKAFATGMGWAQLWPADDEALERMAAGQPCVPECREGCGQ